MISKQLQDLCLEAGRFEYQVGSTVARTCQPRILMYHRVIDSEHRLAVTPRMFRRHLTLFEKMGLEVLSVGDLLSRREEPELNAIALSFDGGFEEIASVVAPELKARGMNATFCVLPHFGTTPAVFSPEANCTDCGALHLSHEQIAALDQDGFEIAAHGLTHRNLPDLPNLIAERELVESRLELETILGHRVRGFSYPGGSYRFNHIEMANKAGYEYALTVDPGHLGTGSPDHLLPRTEVLSGDDPMLLKSKLAGGIDFLHSSLQPARKLNTLIAVNA